MIVLNIAHAVHGKNRQGFLGMLQSGNKPRTERFKSDQKEKYSCVGLARKNYLEE